MKILILGGGGGGGVDAGLEPRYEEKNESTPWGQLSISDSCQP